jgi:hypothetical protein
MMQIRRRDFLWLRLAALVDPPFSDGVPWAISPRRFTELQRLHLVEPRKLSDSHVRAVATPAGHALLGRQRSYLASRLMEGPDHG